LRPRQSRGVKVQYWFMYDDEVRPDRRSRPALVAFLTSLATTAVAFAGLSVADRRGLFDFLHADRGPAEPVVVVPSINGLSVDQAREVLRSKDLLLTLQAELPDPDVPAGRVVGQAPLAGSRTPRGAAIQAIVSKGASAVAIPTLTGARPDDAVEQLRNRKLAPGRRREEASETVGAGLVIGTDPPAGRLVSPEAEVTLIISTGSALKPVPKVLGFRLGKARKTLEDAGFKVGTTRTGSSDRYDDEVIIKQEPAEGTPAARASPVNLIVNE
jgi:beta-lactam-binding protein with PASTA domain